MAERARHLKAKEIFMQAVETNPRDREQYVAWVCAGDECPPAAPDRAGSRDCVADHSGGRGGRTDLRMAAPAAREMTDRPCLTLCRAIC